MAVYTHKYCLFCRKSEGLHQIKPESIIFAYQNYGLIIKQQARCCSKHLENNGMIKASEYHKIPRKNQLFDEDAIKILDMSLMICEKIQYDLTHSSGIFDKFKDMASLDENICIKLTGWTKLQLYNFSKYIKNIRDTNGRTKEQLIAIYRYWLSKGLDQSSLAMLKSNTSQQQISHYLAQIRSAMNKDIVPLFLGAQKDKDFYLKHNTESVKIIHDLAEDVLAVIVDGTYTRLEKSSNNDFQYLSYSMQKSHNLIKPFIMCCADGYFIDCYGPFPANMNDAQIFRYVLNTDNDLNKLFTPKEKIVFFLDRGDKNLLSQLYLV